MGARLTIRIAGFALNSHGVAFAVVEDAERLIVYGYRKRSSVDQMRAVLEEILERYNPLFVACEIGRNSHRSVRACQFDKILGKACSARGLMILCVERCRLRHSANRYPTNHEIAIAAARRFPSLAKQMPAERQIWQGPRDGIGVFLAMAAAAAGWDHFRADGSGKNGRLVQ